MCAGCHADAESGMGGDSSKQHVDVPGRVAFTLIELLVVIAIIGIAVRCYCRRCNSPVRLRDKPLVETTSIKSVLAFTPTTTCIGRCRLDVWSGVDGGNRVTRKHLAWSAFLLPFIE